MYEEEREEKTEAVNEIEKYSKIHLCRLGVIIVLIRAGILRGA